MIFFWFLRGGKGWKKGKPSHEAALSFTSPHAPWMLLLESFISMLWFHSSYFGDTAAWHWDNRVKNQATVCSLLAFNHLAREDLLLCLLLIYFPVLDLTGSNYNCLQFVNRVFHDQLTLKGYTVLSVCCKGQEILLTSQMFSALFQAGFPQKLISINTALS